MKWLRKWGYLVLMLLVGILYFSYVDEWRVYAKALSPVAEWYDEQSDKYEVLATVNDWFAGVLEQGVILAGKLGIDDLPDWLENGSADDNAVGDGQTQPESDNSGQMDMDEGTGNEDGSTDLESIEPDDAGQSEAGGGELPETDITGGTHIAIGGPESGMEMEFGEDVQEGPDYRRVEDDYFADAVFIGDSRTVGMFEYGGLEEITTFYASKGLSVYDVFDKKIVEVPGQKQKITVEEALQQNSFSKIYLMLGLNEMGTGTTETFLAKYGEVLAYLQELQPDAIIYVQAIMKLSTERSGKGDQFHNPGIEERNQGLSQFADGEKVFFLDVNPLICDETGGMIEEYTSDGIHLKAKYIEIWKEYLKEHAIIP